MKPNGDTARHNGSHNEDEIDHDDAEGQDREPRTPTEPTASPRNTDIAQRSLLMNGVSERAKDVQHPKANVSSEESREIEERTPAPSDTPIDDKSMNDDSKLSDESKSLDDRKTSSNRKTLDDTANQSPDTALRLEALAQERDALREEVAQVRRSLEEIQEKHEKELGNARERLVETQGEKEQAETQYRSLLGKVSTIRSQLGERLKADAVRMLPSPSVFYTHISVGRLVAST